jgi:hypothetical protein
MIYVRRRSHKAENRAIKGLEMISTSLCVNDSEVMRDLQAMREHHSHAI